MMMLMSYFKAGPWKLSNFWIKVLFVLLSLYQKTLHASNVQCAHNDRNCQLEISSDETTIDQQLVTKCPISCEKLSIISLDTVGRTIHPDAFLSSTSLTSLSIKANLMLQTNYDWMRSLQSVRSLSLSGCGLKNMNAFAFLNGSQHLTTVDLSNNNLEQIPIGFFISLPQLSSLDLSLNAFKVFPNLVGTNASINIDNNPLACTCSNVDLYRKANFIPRGFVCNVAPCPYFLSFSDSFQNGTVIASVAGQFNISCQVNSSDDARFGIYSPIGFIPGPTWRDPSGSLKIATYVYEMMPLQTPIKLTAVKTSEKSFDLIVHYARGHHAGEWQCAAICGGSYILDNQKTLVIIESCLIDLFRETTIVGVIVTVCALFLGVFIGSLRYLIETRCFKQRQSHKYVGVPLIGVIPVPPPQTKQSTFAEPISLNQRICPECLMKSHFTCGYCLAHHAFSEFEIGANDSVSSSTQSRADCAPRQRSGTFCPVEAPSPLLGSDASPPLSPKVIVASSDEQNQASTSTEISRPQPNRAELNYDFPSEFCHCVHMDMRFMREHDGETFNLRDVKLVFFDDELAQEYTEVLERLQAAANSNDAATFRSRLEEFRAKLVHDVGKGVRVARDEIFALKERSAKSVAYLKDQSGVVAQRMRAGLIHMKDGMRSMAEMCGGGALTTAESTGEGGGPCATLTETIGQSISVVSVYRDETTNEPKERCVSNFQF